MNAPKCLLPLTFSVLGAFCGASQGLAAPILAPDLASFAVLGAAGVTNVPTSTIGGNLGSAPNASVGGGYVFTSGSLQANTATAQQAQLDLDAAITTLNLMSPSSTLGADLTGTISPGVYAVLAGPTNLSGPLILDGGGSNTAVWVFQFASTLITSTTSNVSVTNVGDGSDVGIYWVVGSAATLNGPTFAGNVLAHDLISSDGNLTITCGRLLSAETQVTLIQDKISIGCGGIESTGFGSGGFDQGVDIGSGGEIAGVVPEPTTLALLSLVFAGIGWARRREPN